MSFGVAAEAWTKTNRLLSGREIMAPAGRSASDRAEEIFRENGGTLRTSEALEAGNHPRTLCACAAY